MIVGVFRDGMPRLLLTLHGERGSLALEFILDTGFEAQLTLPSDVLRRLGAVGGDPQRVRYADGTVETAYAYRLALSWDGEVRGVEALALEGNPLLGTETVTGCLITIDATESGEVTIEAQD